MRDALPFPMPISERIAFLYFERSLLERDGNSLIVLSGQDRIQIPIGRTSVLMLGPGVSVSHAAISLCALEGALIIWVGEAGVRFYASANPRSNANAILQQASLRLDESTRLAAAKRIYRLMFDEAPPERRSIDQLRGLEGSKVKAMFKVLANQHGLQWEGRKQSMDDPLNAAISTATSALYGVTEAAILALGYSPAIGMIHSGDPRSFVFDVADTLKFKTVVPLAFELVKESKNRIEQRTRAACREYFYKNQIPGRLVSIIEEVMNANGADRPT